MCESQKTMSEITLPIRTFRMFGLSLKQRFQEYLMPRLNSEALQPFFFFFFFSVVLLAYFFLFRIFWNNVTPSVSPLPLSVASSLLFADSWHLSLGLIVLNLKLPEENVRPDVFIGHHAAQYGVCVCVWFSLSWEQEGFQWSGCLCTSLSAYIFPSSCLRQLIQNSSVGCLPHSFFRFLHSFLLRNRALSK